MTSREEKEKACRWYLLTHGIDRDLQLLELQNTVCGKCGKHLRPIPPDRLIACPCMKEAIEDVLKHIKDGEEEWTIKGKEIQGFAEHMIKSFYGLKIEVG